MIVVDTNVLIDMRELDTVWHEWSFRAVADARLCGEVVTISVSIGELSFRGGSLAELEALCGEFGVGILPLSSAGAYCAGQAQRVYRAAGGRREKLLADFLIGGEAHKLSASILTRDPRHYRQYFPELTLITPETDNG